MAQFEFKLPDIGEGVVEGEIVKWLVKPGDQIVEDQPLVEVMTDKATVTIPSPRRGKVLQTFGKEGDTAKVHGTLVLLEVEGGTATAQAAPSLPPQQAGQPAPLQAAGAPQPQASGNGDERRVLATPVTRRMAREMGVDLAQLQGSGPQGRVMKADVLAHAEYRSNAPPPSRTAAPRVEALQQDEVRPLRGLRKSIARTMTQSHNFVVPFTFVEECDTAALSAMRERINAGLVKRGDAKLSYLPFIAKALLRGFARYPELNAIMDEEKQALVVKKEVNVGFGAATDQGLTVFVVRDIAHKSLREIGAEIDRLAVAARDNKLQLHELQGSTFTITSLGRDGGLMATPVVKHPEVAILGVHKIKEYAKPTRLASGQVHVEVAERMNLSCSFDHRVIDGHIGAAFLYEVIRALESPELLLVDCC
ncbi:MAG: 2-oxo acid dehydrogenase subunit E2 [Deltaproteobacteria bacterium]|nr:MAG: 2-oxo acid dehydrogenase subunit E2 [Deltaproteobacteria bacterium]